MADFDQAAARHEATLHTIIGPLHLYIGATQEFRRKGRADDATGRRLQLPTLRSLPARREAIEHARKHGLITDDEYRSANPTTATSRMPDDEDLLDEVKRFEEAYLRACPETVAEQFERRRQLWLPLVLHAERAGPTAANRLPI